MKLLGGAICMLSTAASMPSTFQSVGQRKRSCATANQVVVAINNYVIEVTQVNDVIDNNGLNETSNTFQEAVSSGLFFETDETIQLTSLSNICNPREEANGAAYSVAINTVQSATQQVLGAIIDNQKGVGAVQDSLDIIDQHICTTVYWGKAWD
ncbi:hypothetical protein BKA67DRAFT_529060 [Truncatella angustata]|uniref:Uncharacterized protein n=1 Tax=Truncatella angustata TaxID=152316 RepID=A0A9P8UVB2_9PEZI|nr:uncharacterized protein BKA67DRAFT_529060 [Truncatella angustata]KAH6658868.1 hypothetical protein BKA67DRAFT_529060 [Truncatella angustata]